MLNLAVTVFNPETSEHEQIKNVYRIEDTGDRLWVYYLEDNVFRKGLKIPKDYITHITIEY